MRYTTFDSPLGPILLAGGDDGLRVVRFLDGDGAEPPPATWTPDPEGFLEATEQLRAYFAGERTTFDLPLAPRGTPFQQQVWDALREVPYGQTTSYGALAARLGRPGAARAVGAANGRNPLAIVVPCHRVIGADGSLTGYAGGLRFKQALLAAESGAPYSPS